MRGSLGVESSGRWVGRNGGGSYWVAGDSRVHPDSQGVIDALELRRVDAEPDSFATGWVVARYVGSVPRTLSEAREMADRFAFTPHLLSDTLFEAINADAVLRWQAGELSVAVRYFDASLAPSDVEPGSVQPPVGSARRSGVRGFLATVFRRSGSV
jgi:hypothetical protein